MIDLKYDILQEYPVIGIDEVGRGAWAGPVYAGAAFLNYKKSSNIPKEINDSKLLNQKSREEILEKLKNYCNLSVGVVEAKYVDKLGLQKAIFLAMEKALFNLNISKKLQDYIIIIDGNILPKFSKKNLNVRNLVKGDTISPSIAVASIYAKVKRDNFMKILSKRYPQYKWDKNKGYGTKDHRLAIELYGPTQEHRLSFKPLKFLKKKHFLQHNVESD